MKVAIFLPSLHGGGAEKMMLRVAGGLSGHGHDVTLVLRKAEGPHLEWVPKGVQIVDLGISSEKIRNSLLHRLARKVWLHPFLAALFLSSVLFKLTRYLQQERPDAMLSAMTMTNITALLARRMARVRTRLVISERNTFSLNTRKDGKLKAVVQRWGARLTYRWADGITAVTAGVAGDLTESIGIPRDSITVVHNPTVTQWVMERGNERESGGNGPKTILAVGRLTLQKDYPTLIHAFAKVRWELDARLVILGEGELRAELEQMIPSLGLTDSIELRGWVDNPYTHMAQCDVFVLSSAWEGFPNVLVEAMACGAQVVATDCAGDGPREILEDGKWGRLVPTGDADALAEAILEILDAPLDSEQLKARASEFSVDRAVDQYLKVLGLQPTPGSSSGRENLR